MSLLAPEVALDSSLVNDSSYHEYVPNVQEEGTELYARQKIPMNTNSYSLVFGRVYI